jgi:hypothetical protein
MPSKAEIRPDWGHALLTPTGQEIRLPAFAFPKLRRLGLLQRGHTMPRLRHTAYQWMINEYDCVTDGLRQLLGPDLSGPAWCVCHCKDCQKQAAQADHTDEPGMRRARASMQADDVIKQVKREAKR